MLLQVFIIAIALVGLAFAGFAIKMFFIKGAEFKKQCSSVDPATGKKLACGCGEGGGSEACENK
jgi:hypothetical protein